MRSTSYTTGPIQPIPHCDPICHAGPQVSGSSSSKRRYDTTCRLPTSHVRSFSPAPQRTNPCAGTHRYLGPTGNSPTGQRHRPQLIRRKKGSNRTLTAATPVQRVLLPLPQKKNKKTTPPPSFPVPSASPLQSPPSRSPASTAAVRRASARPRPRAAARPRRSRLRPTNQSTQPQVSSSSNRFDRNRRTSRPKARASFPISIQISECFLP